LPRAVSAPGDHTAKRGAIAKAVTARGLRGAALDALRERLAVGDVEAGELALVAHEGRDLPLDGVRHVDDDVRLVRAPVPELTHLVRRQSVTRDLLGEVQMVARKRIDGVRRRQPRLAVIAMLE